MKSAFNTLGALFLGAGLAGGWFLPACAEETQSTPPLYYNGPASSTPAYADAVPAGQMSEILKLLQAKVDPAVIKSYIENSPVAFQPTADDLITLKKEGASPEVLKAMVDHAALARSQAEKSSASQSEYTTSPTAQTSYASSTPQTYIPASQNADGSETSYNSGGTTVYPTTYYSSYSYGWPWYIGFGWYWPTYSYGGYYYPYSYCYRGFYPYGYYHGYYPCYRYPYYGYHGYYPYGYAGYYHNHGNQNWYWNNGGHWTSGNNWNGGAHWNNGGQWNHGRHGMQTGNPHPAPVMRPPGNQVAARTYMPHTSMASSTFNHSPTTFRPTSVGTARAGSFGHGMNFGNRPAAPSFHPGGGGGAHFGGGGGSTHMGGGGGMHFGGGGAMHSGGGFGGGGFRH